MAQISLQTAAQNDALFADEFKDVVERDNIWANVATTVAANVRVIDNPVLTVGAAKTHKITGEVPVVTPTQANNTMNIDTYIGNSIEDHPENRGYSQYDIETHMKQRVFASVVERMNKFVTTQVVAGATAESGTKDLSDNAKVQTFIIGIRATNSRIIHTHRIMDGVDSIVAPIKNSQAFLMVGQDAFVNIIDKSTSIVGSVSTRGFDGEVFETPFGVVLGNLGAASTGTGAAKRMVWGTTGVPTIAYRVDRIETDSGMITSSTTRSATSLEVDANDPVIKKAWYTMAQTKMNAGVFSGNSSYVKTQLMT